MKKTSETSTAKRRDSRSAKPSPQPPPLAKAKSRKGALSEAQLDQVSAGSDAVMSYRSGAIGQHNETLLRDTGG